MLRGCKKRDGIDLKPWRRSDVSHSKGPAFMRRAADLRLAGFPLVDAQPDRV